MGRLTLWVGTVLVVASCTTPGPPASRSTPEPPGPVPLVEEVPLAPAGEAPRLLRTTEAPPRVPREAPATLPRFGALDLDRWPFGWVTDPEGPRLGRPTRFWSDSKPLWNLALGGGSGAVGSLETIHRVSQPSEEATRAAWHLWLAYGQAGLSAEARGWLDRVREAWPESALALLETAWDQRFRLNDPDARLWWSRVDAESLAPGDRAKAALLRQKLFLGLQSLEAVGADNFVSTLVLDRDDLWIATWNGAVVRWSLATGEVIRLWHPDQVSPVTRLVTTRWFVYAFQDKGLLRYSKVTGAWRAFDYPPGWTGLRVTGAVATEDEALTVGYLGQGLWRWDGGDWTLVDSAGGGPFVTALGALPGGWLVGTKDRGLWTYRGGLWSPVPGHGPSNVSLVVPGPDGRWAVGTWGEGTWVYDGNLVQPISGGREFVTSAAWDGTPLWGLLDEGLVGDRGQVLGPRDGVGTEVTGLVVWEGRWYWGTDQGVAWWSEHENPALPR